MRWLDAISVLTLVLSTGTLVITAVGTGSATKPGPTDDKPAPRSPSAPIIIDADGLDVGALEDVVGEGDVGAIVFGPELELPDN